MTDLTILKPEIIIIPKSIPVQIKQKIREIVLGCKIIPIMQINSTTLNYFISKDNPPKNIENLDEFIKWHDKLQGVSKEYFYSVYTYIEDVLKKEGYIP